MDGGHHARLVVRIGVVGRTRYRGSEHRQDADADRPIGCRPQVQDVEQDGQRQDADRYVRQRGMDGVAKPLAVEEVLDRPDRPEDRTQPAHVEIAERPCPTRLGVQDPREQATDHVLTSSRERTPARIARPHFRRCLYATIAPCPTPPADASDDLPATPDQRTDVTPRRGGAHVGLRSAQQLRRSCRSDRRDASRDRGAAQVDRREPIPPRAQLLHAAAWPGGAAAGHVHRLADARHARRTHRRRPVHPPRRHCADGPVDHLRGLQRHDVRAGALLRHQTRGHCGRVRGDGSPVETGADQSAARRHRYRRVRSDLLL